MAPSSTSNSAAVALDASELVLSTLYNATQLTPVPYLQNAAGLALNLVNIIQSVKFNKDAFRRLGNDACELVYLILRNDTRAAQNTTALPPAYLEHTKELSEWVLPQFRTLDDIYKFTKAQTSRNKALRVIQYKSDTATIQEYRDRLRHSLEVFNIKSHMLIHNSLASIQGQVAGMAAQIDRIPLHWGREETNMGQQHQGSMDANESGANESGVTSNIEEKSDLARIERERLEWERLEIQTIEKEREKFERERDSKNREKERIVQMAQIEQERLKREQTEHEWNAWRRSVAEYGSQVESELVHDCHHDQHPATHTNPFRRPRLGTPDHPLGYSVDPIYGCPVTTGFPTPLPALPGLTIPSISSSLPGFPSIQADTSATLHLGTGSYYSSIPGFVLMDGNIRTYANSVINSNSGNVTVNNVSNSNIDSSIRLWFVVVLVSSVVY